MEPYDIAAIEARARQLRAQEIQRLSNLFAERMKLYGVLVLGSVVSGLEALAALIRPLFSWNPQAPQAALGPSLAVRANRALRGLFAWNPRHTH